MTETKVLVNQVGYDVEKEKVFILQAEEGMAPGGFEVLGKGDTVAYTGQLEPSGAIPEWGHSYWTGDFTELGEEGVFSVAVKMDPTLMLSPPFKVGSGVVFGQTGDLAQRFFHYQRCGSEVEGWHGPCHMDDGRMPDGSHRDVSGGWHDAGDYNKYNGFTPLSVFSLVYAYEAKRSYYDRSLTNGGIPAIIDEALWGAEWLRKMQPEPGVLLDRVFSGYSYWGIPDAETDNVPASGDERPVEGRAGAVACALTAAAYGKLEALGFGGESYLSLAEALWATSNSTEPSLEGAAALLVAAEALFASTSRREYLHEATRRLDWLLDHQREDGCLLRPDGLPYHSITTLGFPAGCVADFAMRQPSLAGDRGKTLLSRYLDFSIRIADNPFEISTIHAPDGSTCFFHPYPNDEAWYVGQNSQYLSQAWAGLLGYHLTGRQGYRRYALSQINWILGVNPFGVCMFEGTGTLNPGVYHHRYDSIPDHETGAVPGCVPNGIVRRSVGVDAPRFDLRKRGRGDYHSNEPWLPHNAFYLLASSRL